MTNKEVLKTVSGLVNLFKIENYSNDLVFNSGLSQKDFEFE